LGSNLYRLILGIIVPADENKEEKQEETKETTGTSKVKTKIIV